MTRSLFLPWLAFVLLNLSACSDDSSSGARHIDPEKVVDRVVLKPGEAKRYTIQAADTVHVGFACLSEPSGGLVQLQQVGKVGRASSPYWISRAWVPENGAVELELRNNAKGEVEVVVFRGRTPPKGAT